MPLDCALGWDLKERESNWHVLLGFYMRSEPPYDFPRGVTAAIFHQTVRFKTIFWARTNVVKMSFASRPASHVTCA